jgi:membrane-associated phospholipid phosphatase
MVRSLEAILAERIRIGVLAADVIIACAVSIFFLDLRLAQQVIANKDLFTEFATVAVPDLGAPAVLFGVITPFAVLAFFTYDGVRANRTVLVFGAIVAGYLVCGVLKFLFGRSRPELFFTSGIYGFDFFRPEYAFHSFPSGHAATAAALAMTVSLFERARRLILLTLGFVLAVVPVIAGHHYLSDAVAGFAVGIAVAVAFGVLLDACGLPIAEGGENRGERRL